MSCDCIIFYQTCLRFIIYHGVVRGVRELTVIFLGCVW